MVGGWGLDGDCLGLEGMVGDWMRIVGLLRIEINEIYQYTIAVHIYVWYVIVTLFLIVKKLFMFTF